MDEYIAAAPAGTQGKLREVRAAIFDAAPQATEGISYGMPYYSFKGRLAWFALHTAHIGLYLRPPVVAQHKKELEGYGTTKSAVHLSLETRIPVALVRKLVRARVEINEAEEKAKAREKGKRP